MRLEDVPVVIGVASGKGGVGKTTVATDLAAALRDTGLTVGLVDADVSTPNSPEALGGEDLDLGDQRLATHDALIPPTTQGIQFISQGVALPDDVPVLRDGQWRAEVIADYIENVEWDDDTDVVVVDTPPGTGEEIQTIASVTPPDFAFVVMTPHPSAVRDAKKTHEFFKQADIDHKVIVNMAYIPASNALANALDGVDFTEIDMVGDSIDEKIRDLLELSTSDFYLFGYDGDTDDAPAEQIATVPYAPGYEERLPAYDDVVAAVERVLRSKERDESAEAPEEGEA